MRRISIVFMLVVTSTASAFYNPQAGRWLNRDPIAERGGLNHLSFIENDGVNIFDRLGLYPAEVRSITYSAHGSAEPDGMAVPYVNIDPAIEALGGRLPLNLSDTKAAADIRAEMNDSFSAMIIAWTELRNVSRGLSLQMSTDLSGTITVCCSCPSTGVQANYSLSASISRIGRANARFGEASIIADSRRRSVRKSGSISKRLNGSYCATFQFDVGQAWIDELRTGSTLSSVRAVADFQCID